MESCIFGNNLPCFGHNLQFSWENAAMKVSRCVANVKKNAIVAQVHFQADFFLLAYWLEKNGNFFWMLNLRPRLYSQEKGSLPKKNMHHLIITIQFIIHMLPYKKTKCCNFCIKSINSRHFFAYFLFPWSISVLRNVHDDTFVVQWEFFLRIYNAWSTR